MMNNSKIISDPPRGFAGIIQNPLCSLNSNEQFKKRYNNTNMKILLNPTNLNHAALIIISQGQIQVKSVENKPKENLDKNQTGWDAFLEMRSEVFLGLAMNRLSLVSVLIKWMRGEIRMKGILKLMVLLKIFKLLN